MLGIPKRIRVSALLAVGYLKDMKVEDKKRKPVEEILFRERWPSDGNQT